MRTIVKHVLLVSGCSYTDKTFRSDFHPNIDTGWPKWPELLGKKLDMDVVNYGYCGSGNEYIYSSLLDHLTSNPIKDIGLVIPGWSRVPRRDFNVGDRKYNIRWDNHGDMKYFMIKSLRYYYSLQEVCKSLKVPYKQIHILDPYESAVVEQNELFNMTREDAMKEFMSSSYYDKIDEKNFIGWPIESKLGGFCAWDKLDADKHFISEIDRHPNRQGQEIIAELIYENL